jgi:N-formylglutamate amidohydrolase
MKEELRRAKLAHILSAGFPGTLRVWRPGGGEVRVYGTYISGMGYQFTKRDYRERLLANPPRWLDTLDVLTARWALEWAMERETVLPAAPPTPLLPLHANADDYFFPNPDAWADDAPPNGWRAGQGQRRLVLNIPHASTHIPEWLRPILLLDDAALAAEHLKMTDWFTDDLFAVTAHEAERVVAPVSRLLVDTERFAVDADESMARLGMGAIYTRTADGMKLRDAPGEAERRDLMEAYYWAHHNELTYAVGRVRQAFGKAIIVDCHSFSNRPLPHEPDQGERRPDICIGTTKQTSGNAIYAIKAVANEHGLTFAEDTPFAGVVVPSVFVGDPKVDAVMIEVNRRLYLDEATGQPNAGYAATKRILAQMLRRIANAVN